MKRNLGPSKIKNQVIPVALGSCSLRHAAGAMKVLFVRHAQSLNNAVQGRVQQKLASGCSDVQGAQSEWLSMRHEDPPLSDAGR